MGTFTVQVNDNEVFVPAGTLLVDNKIGKRGQARFKVHTANPKPPGSIPPSLATLIPPPPIPRVPPAIDADTHFQQYEQVSIFDSNNVLAFSGYITVPQEQKPGYLPSMDHTVTCTDQTWLAIKRRVAASYTNKTCGFIAQDIATKILSQEGVTIGAIYDGLTPGPTLYPGPNLYPGGNVGLIPQATFVYCTCADAFDALAAQASASGIPYYWTIDQYKQFWFVPYTFVVNSTVIDGSQIDQVYSPPVVTRQNPKLRNTQYLLGGVATTDPQEEIKIGDGSATSWTMGYDLNALPTISVSTDGGSTYQAKNVGLKGVNTGFDFYWAQGDPVIVQDSSGTKLRGSPNFDRLKVDYIGQYPAAIVSSDQAQIAYQKSIDGTSGIIEDVDQDNTITSVSNGLSKVSQLLTRYAQQGTQLVFNTLSSGFAPGQLVTVNLPMHDLNNVQMLIASVSASDQLDALNYWYTVTGIIGPYDITWSDYFGQLLKQQQPANSINIGIGLTLAIVVPFTLKVPVQLGFNPSVNIPPYPSSNLYPGPNLFP